MMTRALISFPQVTLDAAERRFWRYAAHTERTLSGLPGHCIVWTGARTRSKQPQIWMDGKAEYAAIWIWERRNKRRKPPGMQLSPACGWSMCVEPEHRVLRPRGSHLRRTSKEGNGR